MTRIKPFFSAAVIALTVSTLPLLYASTSTAATTAATAATADPAAAKPWKYKTPKLTRAQFDPLLAKPSELVLIDVRRPDELTRIGGFPAYLSIQNDQLEKSLAYIPKDRKIVTVSNHAGRAGAAGDLLTARGFKVAGAVGVENYAEEGGTITRIEPVAPKAAAAGQP